MVTNSPSSAAEAVDRVKQSARSFVDTGLHRLEFRSMSTPCQIKVHGAPASAVQDFEREAVEWVARFEGRYSRFIPDSLISKINAAAGEHWVEIDPETERLFNLCQELFFFTRGSFDPSALPLIQLWNWKQRPVTLPPAEAIESARELVGWNKIHRRPGAIFLPQRGMTIDLGGIGKEYAVDCVMNLAIERGIPNALVDFGQDVRVRGHAPNKTHWRIGLEDALTPGKCWTGVAITDHAVATSGDYFRNFTVNGVRYGHILDPRTGYPALNDCRAAHVIAPSCTMAGLLSTSVCVLGAKDGMELIEMHPQAAGAIATNSNKFYSRKFHEYIPV
jgi:thiamine biosynthesis lipoprotein